MLLNIWNYLWLEATFCLKYLVFVIHCSYWIALHSLRVWIWNENCGEEAYIFPHVRNCHKMIWGGKSHYKPVLSFGQIALILSAPPLFFYFFNQSRKCSPADSWLRSLLFLAPVHAQASWSPGKRLTSGEISSFHFVPANCFKYSGFLLKFESSFF